MCMAFLVIQSAPITLFAPDSAIHGKCIRRAKGVIIAQVFLSLLAERKEWQEKSSNLIL